MMNTMDDSIEKIELLYQTPETWLTTVLNDFNVFLQDHAACERKAHAVAMSLLAHYPDRRELVVAMADLAIEELSHFRMVLKHLIARNITLADDTKDPYVTALRRQVRRGKEVYFLDRLLLAGVVEARGRERFALIAEAHPDETMREFYQLITVSEARHANLFIDLAKCYFATGEIAERLQDWLRYEAEIVAVLPHRSALH